MYRAFLNKKKKNPNTGSPLNNSIYIYIYIIILGCALFSQKLKNSINTKIIFFENGCNFENGYRYYSELASNIITMLIS